MKKITLKELELSVYTEKLANGLDVFFVPMANKKNYYITYATKYGSSDTAFTPVGEKKEMKSPDGIAHFLEHKMFEQEDNQDPFHFFSESGTVCNASTTFDNTQYLCYGSKKFNENLAFLIDYVNQPYFTETNVEKEKGIIVEEIKMYDDIPEYELEFAIRRNIYHEHPNRIDVIGTEESVRSITKEQLYTCYNTFYQPSNMFLIIAGNFNKEEALDIIKEHVKEPENSGKINKKQYKEPKTISEKETIIKRDISIPKASLAFKFSTKDFGNYPIKELDKYLAMFSSLAFGPSSKLKEEAREKQLLNSFSYEWEIVDNYYNLIIMIESRDIDAFIELIMKELENLEITVNDIDRIKKVWVANEIRITDSPEAVANTIFGEYLKYGSFIKDRRKFIENINKKELDNIIKKMNFKNKTIVKLLPLEK